MNLKFRAWHKTLKLMGDVMTLYFGENSDQMIEVDLGEVEGRYLTDPISEFEIIQYIGKKDEDSFEIYEGDILCGWDGEIGKVIFEDSCFNVSGFYCSSQDYPAMAFSENAPFKIIGNIHQNPELMENENESKN